MKKRAAFTITLCLYFLIICGVFSACVSMPEKQAPIRDGVTIDGLDVSGMTAEDAMHELSELHSKALSVQRYVILSEGKEISFSANELGIEYDAQSAIKEALSAEEGANIKSEPKADEEKAKAAIHSVAGKLNREPKAAHAEYKDGGFTFLEGEPGAELDEGALLDELYSSLASPEEKKIELHAELTTKEAEKGGLDNVKHDNTLIGEYTTYFNKDPYNAENRVNNIVKAAGLIDGVKVEAGKRFDTNAVLGDRNGENGWSKAPGIRDGKYEMEYGGGVCQVSTTLYNAALMACLEIAERSPHSWPIGYVPIGRDATISTGGPNLIIENNTESYITISALIDDEEQSITVRIYGRPSDDADYAKVDIESKETGTIPAPETEFIEDKSLSPGQKVTDRKARNGKRAQVERVYYDESGNELRRETVSEDTYRAIGARVLVGV